MTRFSINLYATVAGSVLCLATALPGAQASAVKFDELITLDTPITAAAGFNGSLAPNVALTEFYNPVTNSHGDVAVAADTNNSGRLVLYRPNRNIGSLTANTVYALAGTGAQTSSIFSPSQLTDFNNSQFTSGNSISTIFEDVDLDDSGRVYYGFDVPDPVSPSPAEVTSGYAAWESGDHESLFYLGQNVDGAAVTRLGRDFVVNGDGDVAVGLSTDPSGSLTSDAVVTRTRTPVSGLSFWENPETVLENGADGDDYDPANAGPMETVRFFTVSDLTDDGDLLLSATIGTTSVASNRYDVLLEGDIDTASPSFTLRLSERGDFDFTRAADLAASGNLFIQRDPGGDEELVLLDDTGAVLGTFAEDDLISSPDFDSLSARSFGEFNGGEQQLDDGRLAFKAATETAIGGMTSNGIFMTDDDGDLHLVIEENDLIVGKPGSSVVTVGDSIGWTKSDAEVADGDGDLVTRVVYTRPGNGPQTAIIRLETDDAALNSDSNEAPDVSGIPDGVIDASDFGGTITLDASAASDDGIITDYEWDRCGNTCAALTALTGGPNAQQNVPVGALIGTAPGQISTTEETATLRMRATDGIGETSDKEVEYSYDSASPTLGADFTMVTPSDGFFEFFADIDDPDMVFNDAVNGFEVLDVDFFANGSAIAGFQDILLTAPTEKTGSPLYAIPVAALQSALMPGDTYTIGLTVTDLAGNTASGLEFWSVTVPTETTNPPGVPAPAALGLLSVGLLAMRRRMQPRG